MVPAALLGVLSTAGALTPGCGSRPVIGSRRAVLSSAVGAMAAAAAPPRPAFASLGNAADVAQVLQSYQTLTVSLEQWASETALMQIGRPTQLQRAVDQLPEETLKRLSMEKSLSECIAALRKTRQSSLTFLYLASGATKYESQEVGLKYMADVKTQVAAEREELLTLGKLLGIDLSQPAS